MGTSETYLPRSLSTDSIIDLIESLDLPSPTSVKPLQERAAFHTIYLVHFAAEITGEISAHKDPDDCVDLILRISGRQLPGIKTRNEVGVMAWVRENTRIPVPSVVRFDATENNPVGHEFTLLEKARGISADKVYSRLSGEAKTSLVEQLTDYLVELHAKPWDAGYVGGLVLNDQGSIDGGPPIDEAYWRKFLISPSTGEEKRHWML